MDVWQRATASGDGTAARLIRQIGPDGIISTFAGKGRPGSRGDGGPAFRARLNSPRDVAVAADGTVVIADSYNDCVRGGSDRSGQGGRGRRPFRRRR